MKWHEDRYTFPPRGILGGRRTNVYVDSSVRLAARCALGGWQGPLNRLDAFAYEIPQSYKAQMRTSGLIFIDEPMIAQLRQDQAAEQVANVATMPGIVGRSMAMPDIHWGYGFPIGGVAAFDVGDGVISPGG